MARLIVLAIVLIAFWAVLARFLNKRLATYILLISIVGYLVLKLTGVIDAIAPSRMGIIGGDMG